MPAAPAGDATVTRRAHPFRVMTKRLNLRMLDLDV